MAAAQNPRGLETIVPSAGLASMYDHQFQDGVPYWLQWVGPMEAYEQLALERKLPPFSDPTNTVHPGGDFSKAMEDAGCGMPNSSLIAGEDQLSGRYSAWHEQRDWRAGATAARIPVFAVHGVNDNAARVAALDGSPAPPRRRQAVARPVGPRLGLLPEPRGDRGRGAHASFDKQLAKREVSTGPAVELFLNDGTFENARAATARARSSTQTRWPVATQQRTFFPSADGVLEDSPETQAAASRSRATRRASTDRRESTRRSSATPCSRATSCSPACRS